MGGIKMNDDFLTQFRKSPRREFTANLYQRINKPMPKQSALNTTLFRRTALAFGALAILLTLTLMLSPSARAFVGDQIRQFGGISLSPVDSSEYENGAAPQPTIPAPAEITAELVNDAVEAAVLAGFTVKTPGYLPEGYTENSPWSVDNRDCSIYVVASYGSTNGRHFLLMNQTLFAEDAVFEQQYAENETVTDVMVGQYPGVYLTGRLMAHPNLGVRVRNEAPTLIPTNWLVWEANGITYTLFGDALDQSQLIQIAESLTG
jgi:Domain of unknown function (DUF4367)